MEYGAWILVNDAGGLNLWRGNSSGLQRLYGISDANEFAVGSQDFELALPAYADEYGVDLNADPKTRSAAWRNAAIADAKQDPQRVLGFLVSKTWRFVRPWLDPRIYSPPIVATSAILVACLELGALLGLAALQRSPEKNALILLLVFGLATHVPFQVVARFRVASWDPFLIILTACGIATLWKSTFLWSSKIGE